MPDGFLAKNIIQDSGNPPKLSNVLRKQVFLRGKNEQDLQNYERMMMLITTIIIHFDNNEVF